MKIDCKITTIKDKNKIIHLIYITPAPHYTHYAPTMPPRQGLYSLLVHSYCLYSANSNGTFLLPKSLIDIG